MPKASPKAWVYLLLLFCSPGVAQPLPVPILNTSSSAQEPERVFEGTEFPADSDRDSEATEKSAPVVVVSGGISLGAYQAGFISTLVRFWSVARRDGEKSNLGDPTPRVWTGASAGAVNALLGGLASCDPAFEQSQWKPEKSLFWEVWIRQLDLSALLPWKDNGRSDHLFSEPHMRHTLEMIEKRALKTHFRPECSFAFGITVTNLSGREIPFGWGGPDSKAQLTRVTEKFVAQVFTKEDGTLRARLPFIEGAVHAVLPYISVRRDELLYYPALGARPENEGGQSVSLKNLLLIPQASGAFPLAFPPVSLRASLFNDVQWSNPLTLRLVDGGFLNNNPLDLAVRLGAHWNELPGKPAKCDDETRGPRAGQVLSGPTVLDRCRFPIVYLDQDVVDWKWKPAEAPREETRSPLLEAYFRHLGNLVSAAQDSVVLDTLEHDSKLSGRIKIPRRSYVLPSEFRFAMLGFFDQRFREHDFYRGIQDAIHFLATQLTSTRVVQSIVPRVSNETILEREQRIKDVLAISSDGFACVSTGNCDAFAGGDALGRLSLASSELTQLANDKQLEQDDLDRLLAALSDAGYQYSGGVMEGGKATGTRADLLPVRVRIGRAFHDLVSHQAGGLKLGLRPAGAAFLDEWLTYTHPRHALTLQVSRQRGLGIGIEAPVSASEERGVNIYDRRELRIGTMLSALGMRDMDQISSNRRRWRWVSVGAYLDWVSDLDGFSGRFKSIDLGPYVRWRAGLGITGSYLSVPTEFAFQIPEARLGVDIAEMLGLRLTVPLLLFKKAPGEPLRIGTPHYYRETSVGVEALITYW